MVETSSSRWSSRWSAVALAYAVAAVAAAACAREATRGGPAFRPDGDDDPAAAGLQVHFGPVLLGAQAQRSLTLHPPDGDGHNVLHVASVDTPAAGFDDSFAVATAESADGSVALTLSFTPRALGSYSTRITIQVVGGGSDGTTSVPVEITGAAVERCAPSDAQVIDFATVPVGDAAERRVAIVNPGATPWRVSIPPLPHGSGPFSLGDGFSAGERTLEPGGAIEVPVEFRPTAHGAVTSPVATWPAPAGCPSQLTLTGFGLSSTLTCEPTITENGRPMCRIDFGLVEPGTRGRGTVTFRNSRSVEVAMGVSSMTQPPGGVEVFTPRSARTSFTVPPAGDAPLEIALDFAPPAAGWYSGVIEFWTDDPTFPAAVVDLRGGGIGVKAVISPDRVDFGAVEVLALPHAEIEIRNDGIGSPDGGPGSLLLASAPAPGTWVERRPEIVEGADVFSVMWPPRGYGPDGIAPNSSAWLQVVFAPSAFGRYSGTLRIFTNDPQNRTVDVPLVATVAHVETCDLEVSPAQLHFGLIERAGNLTLPVILRNRSTEVGRACDVRGFQVVSVGDAQAITLVEGADHILLGGEEYVARVRFAPKAAGQFYGALLFQTSADSEGNGLVPVDAECGTAPATVAPHDLDLQPDDHGCLSTADVTVTNNVGTAVGVDLAVDPDALDDGFEPTSVLYPGGMTLNAGGKVTIHFRLSSSRLGVHAGAATLAVSGLATPLKIGLHAVVVAPTLWTDEFPPNGASVRTTFPLTHMPESGDKSAFTVEVDGVAAPQSRWTYSSYSNAIVFSAPVAPGPDALVRIGYRLQCK